jgi:hypothetical protein
MINREFIHAGEILKTTLDELQEICRETKTCCSEDVIVKSRLMELIEHMDTIYSLIDIYSKQK